MPYPMHPCMTWPANGDVATPSLTSPIRSERPLARLRAITFCQYPKSSATFLTFCLVDSGILTFMVVIDLPRMPRQSKRPLPVRHPVV